MQGSDEDPADVAVELTTAPHAESSTHWGQQVSTKKWAGKGWLCALSQVQGGVSRRCSPTVVVQWARRYGGQQLIPIRDVHSVVEAVDSICTGGISCALLVSPGPGVSVAAKLVIQ